MRAFAFALLTAALTVFDWSFAEAHHVDDDSSFLSASVAYIRDGDKIGAGVLVGNRTVLTAAHVVERSALAQRPASVSFKEDTVGGSVLWIDRGLDLAIVRLERRPLFAVVARTSCERLRVGEPLTAVGHPLNIRWSHVPVTVMADADSAKHELKLDEAYAGPTRQGVLVVGPVNVGSSGGPAFDASGAVRGIVSRCLTFGFRCETGFGLIAGPDAVCEALRHK